MTDPWLDESLASNGFSVRENFARWFGSSRVVNARGEPLLVYHGSGSDIQEFRAQGGTGKTADTGSFFTSSQMVANSYATYLIGGSPNIMPVYLSLQSPVVVDARGLNWNRIAQSCEVMMPAVVAVSRRSQEIEDLAAQLEDREPIKLQATRRKERSTNVRQMFRGEWDYPDDTASTDDLARWARSEGYDGLIVRNVVDRGPGGLHTTEASLAPATLYVAFNASQIKSALGNSGLYLSDSASVVDDAAYLALARAQRAKSEVAKLTSALCRTVTP